MSQTGDGIITAGVGTYVFFNASSFPSPAAGAAAFTVLYLPYSLVGPFAGVFIDRWSRRQILVWSALLRAVFVVADRGADGGRQPRGRRSTSPSLLVLGVNRFFLSSLSAALPHVVDGDQLVMANSVSPTAGGIMATSSACVAARGSTWPPATPSAAPRSRCWSGAAVTWRPALVAATMPRDLLGPVREPGSAAAGAAGQ